MSAPDGDMIMVGHAYGGPVMRALLHAGDDSERAVAYDAYMRLLVRMERDTGELKTTVQQLADDLDAQPSEIERAMLMLARLGVVVRDPRRADDAWFINPHLAWSGSLEKRAVFAALVAPPAVEAGRAG